MIQGGKVSNKSNVEKNVKIVCAIMLGLFICSTIYFLSSFSKIKTEYSISQFLPSSHPRLKMDQQVRKSFHISESPAFIVTVQTHAGDWFEKKRLKELQDVSNKISNWTAVHRAISIGNLTGAFMQKGQLMVGPLIEQGKLKDLKSRLLNDPLITPGLLSKNGKTALLYVELKDVSVQEMTTVQNKLKPLLKSTFPEAHVLVGGVPAIQSDISHLLSKEVQRFVLLALLFTMVSLFLIFKGFMSLILTSLVVIVGNAWMIGFMLAMNLPLTVLSTTLPILISVMVVSLVVRSLLRFHEVREEPGRDVFSALFKSQKDILFPNFLATFTTSVGFLTLLSSSSPMIRQYGWTVGGSIFLSWAVSSLTLIPLILFFPKIEPRKWITKPASWSLWITNHPKRVFVSLSVFFAILGLIGTNLNWRSRLFDDLPANIESRRATQLVDKNMGGLVPFDLIIDGHQKEFWNSPDNIKKLNALSLRLRAIEGVGSVKTIYDFVRIADGRHAMSRAQLAEIYFLYSLNADNPLSRYLNGDAQKTRVEIRLQDIPQVQSQLLMAKIEKETLAEFKGSRLEFGGMGSTVHIVNREISKDLIFGFWHALLIISIALVFVLRSWKLAVVAAYPNLSSPAVLLGFMALTSTPIKPGLALVFSIALGLAYDNTLYLLSRLKQIKKETGVWNIGQAFYIESHPCLISTLVVASGFFAFLLSYFEMNRIFGAYMLLSIGAALIGDLVLFPSFLKVLPQSFWSNINKVDVKSETTSQIKDWPRVAASLFIIAFGLQLFVAPVVHATEGAELIQKAKKNLYTAKEGLKIKMKILDKSGDKKEREIEMTRLSGEDHRFYAKILKPRDLKGMSFLSVVKGEEQQQWIYLPSSKQTRKVVGATGGDSGILGSDLTTDDLDFEAFKGSQAKILKKEKEQTVVESKLSKGPYSKVWLWVDDKKGLPMKVEYFSAKKKVKTVEFTKYRNFKNVWRAQKVIVKNLDLGRETQVEMLSWNPASQVTTRELSSQNLSRLAEE